VPDLRDGPVLRWGEELRRRRRDRHSGRRRLIVTAAAAVAATALAATAIRPPRPLLVWNASASTAQGLYAIIGGGESRIGETVVAWPPDEARRLAAERKYLPAGVPLVKRVAAVAGDRVCAAGEAVFVGDRLEALRKSEDAAGRPLPWWTGCIRLRQGELLLLNRAADSFDGRYFGITPPSDVIGRARPIWAR
jgi:conjugative transfer signal peptidase TraF